MYVSLTNLTQNKKGKFHCTVVQQESMACKVCNESLRAAIQKCYAGLDDAEDDGRSDQGARMFDPALRKTLNWRMWEVRERKSNNIKKKQRKRLCLEPKGRK